VSLPANASGCSDNFPCQLSFAPSGVCAVSV
jgi:hypothetical protein